jgi:hypothetical protein
MDNELLLQILKDLQEIKTDRLLEDTLSSLDVGDSQRISLVLWASSVFGAAFTRRMRYQALVPAQVKMSRFHAEIYLAEGTPARGRLRYR